VLVEYTRMRLLRCRSGVEAVPTKHVTKAHHGFEDKLDRITIFTNHIQSAHARSEPEKIDKAKNFKAEIVDDAKASVRQTDVPSPSRPCTPAAHSRPSTSLALGRSVSHEEESYDLDIQEPIAHPDAIAQSVRVEEERAPRRSSRKHFRSNSVSRQTPTTPTAAAASERSDRAGSVKIRPSLAPSFVSQDATDFTSSSFVHVAVTTEGVGDTGKKRIEFDTKRAGERVGFDLLEGRRS
jgi:hypothetical protein